MTSEEDWGLYQVNLICSDHCTTKATLKWNISAHENVSCAIATVDSSVVQQSNSTYGMLSVLCGC